jgi:large subunit ribosomal protein L25
VAGERVRLEVQEREARGSRESRRLRKQGLVPGVLYGRGKKPHAICVHERELRRVLSGAAGLHTILDVVIGDQKTTHASVLKEYQRDPVRGTLTHVDLQEVRLDQPIQAQVAVALVGEAAGVKEGGVLSQVTREVTVEALPLEMPEHLELDVSAMAVGDTFRVSALADADGIRILDDPETVLATLTPPTRVVEEVPEEEAEAAEAGAEGEAPEGAAAEAEAGTGPQGEPGTAEG